MDEEHYRWLKKHATGYVGRNGWVCYFWFIDWWHWSLGFNIFLPAPNIEIHIPFGFIRIGKQYPWMRLDPRKV